jgi:DNA polymerase III gamma/tau subunit
MDAKAEGLKEELEVARQQVVSSPARLKGDVEHMAKLVEDAHAALAATASEAASLQCRSEVVAKATKDVRKTLTLLAELETEVLRLKKVHKEAKAKAAAKEEKAAELADAQAAAERLERRVRAAEEKLTEQKHSAYVKQEATQRANQALREELQNSQNELDRARGAQKEAATRIGAIKTDVSERAQQRSTRARRPPTRASPTPRPRPRPAFSSPARSPRPAARPHSGAAQRRNGRDGGGDEEHPAHRRRLPHAPVCDHGRRGARRLVGAGRRHVRGERSGAASCPTPLPPVRCLLLLLCAGAGGAATAAASQPLKGELFPAAAAAAAAPHYAAVPSRD